jgi:predicted methyltransferase
MKREHLIEDDLYHLSSSIGRSLFAIEILKETGVSTHYLKQIIKNIDLIWNVYTSVNKDITLLWNVDKLLSDVILNFNLYIQQDLEIETKIQQLLSMRNNINQINDKVRQNYVR